MSARPKSAPSTLRSPPAMEGRKESAVSRLLIAPLTFISFLFSLALIDYRNHSFRTHYHSSNRPAPTTLLGSVKAFFHRCVYKETLSSPYSYISESSNSTSGTKEGNEPWHWHSKQRKMMKAELSDAYRMKNSVLVVLIAGVLVLGPSMVYGAWCLMRWMTFLGTRWLATESKLIGGVHVEKPQAAWMDGL